MIGRLARAAAVTALAATLSSCWLVYSSPFPEFSSLILNQVDLGAHLPADRNAEVRIACYDDGTTEYLFLLVRGSTAGEHLLIFDEQLALRYETTDTAADQFAVHSPIVTKPTGEVFVGLLAFPAGLGEPSTLSANNLEWNHTLYDVTTDELIAVAPNGPQLDFVTVPTSPEATGIPDTMAIDLSGGGYGPLSAAYSLRTGLAGLATADETNRVVAGFIGTTATIRTAPSILTATELVTNPGGYTFPVTHAIGQVFPVPSGVVVEYEEDGLHLTYYDYSGTEGPQLYHERGDVRLAFSMAGEHFYLFERERNTIVKVRTWW